MHTEMSPEHRHPRKAEQNRRLRGKSKASGLSLIRALTLGTCLDIRKLSVSLTIKYSSNIMVKEQQTLYVSPQVEIVEIKSQAIICQSGNDINDLNLRDDDSSNWS